MNKEFSLRCPNCGMVMHQPQVRCPRCNTSLKDQLVCNGDCKSCQKHHC